MTIRKIYEKVCLVEPIEERRFFSSFEDSVNELEGLYGKFVFEEESKYSPPETLNDEIVVRPLYHNAIVDNILYLNGQGEAFKGEFLRKSRSAYFHYWTINAKGRRVKRSGW